jgi:hypothetical protein
LIPLRCRKEVEREMKNAERRLTEDNGRLAAEIESLRKQVSSVARCKNANLGKFWIIDGAFQVDYES